MKTIQAIALSALTTLVVLGTTFVAVELALRAYYHFNQSYLVEMWRYGRNHKEFTGDKRSHAHRPGTTSQVMHEPVRIDKWGFRGPDRDPLLSARRVLILGDSVTFGFGVAEDEAFPALLEKSVPGLQVWNSGVGNYNTEQEFATLPVNLPRIRPNEVILAFFINDLEPVQKGSDLPVLQNSLLISLLTQVWWSYADTSRRNFLDYYQKTFDTGWDKWAQASEDGIAALKAAGVPLKVLLIPEFHLLKTGKFAANYGRVADFFRARGVAVCDAETYFPPTATAGHEYWAAPDDSHPNAAAHKILSQALVACFYPEKKNEIDRR